jgi:hypothetical protein
VVAWFRTGNWPTGWPPDDAAIGGWRPDDAAIGGWRPDDAAIGTDAGRRHDPGGWTR